MSTAPSNASSIVSTAFRALQDEICAGLEAEDGAAKFTEDNWSRPEGGGGRTRTLSDGAIFEKAGVAFSHVQGDKLPPAASALRPELAGKPWEALGVSIVVHPRNPYVPTSHANIRFFIAGGADCPASAELPRAEPGTLKAPQARPTFGGGADRPGTLDEPQGRQAYRDGPLHQQSLGSTQQAEGPQSGSLHKQTGEPVWWFGGGMDLTPYYGFTEDAVHWHRTARAAVEPFGSNLFPRFKRTCDQYFVLKHRGEQRGIGGIFFDDFTAGGFDSSLALTQAVGAAYLKGYRPIVARRKETPYGERERQFQLYRRGRYVEFNLVWDRGTLFGLQSGGRTESILMSLPPLVRWEYGFKPEPNSPEARLNEEFLTPRDWADYLEF